MKFQIYLTQGGHELWKTGKTGKMVKKKSLQGKIREFRNKLKIREKSGNLVLNVFICLNIFIATCMKIWLLVFLSAILVEPHYSCSFHIISRMYIYN